MGELPADHEWSVFAEANGDLLSGSKAFLGRYYRPETLGSERARRSFVFPELGAAS